MYSGALHERARRQRAQYMSGLIFAMAQYIKRFFERKVK